MYLDYVVEKLNSIFYQRHIIQQLHLCMFNEISTDILYEIHVADHSLIITKTLDSVNVRLLNFKRKTSGGIIFFGISTQYILTPQCRRKEKQLRENYS